MSYLRGKVFRGGDDFFFPAIKKLRLEEHYSFSLPTGCFEIIARFEGWEHFLNSANAINEPPQPGYCVSIVLYTCTVSSDLAWFSLSSLLKTIKIFLNKGIGQYLPNTLYNKNVNYKKYLMHQWVLCFPFLMVDKTNFKT